MSSPPDSSTQSNPAPESTPASSSSSPPSSAPPLLTTPPPPVPQQQTPVQPTPRPLLSEQQLASLDNAEEPPPSNHQINSLLRPASNLSNGAQTGLTGNSGVPTLGQQQSSALQNGASLPKSTAGFTIRKPNRPGMPPAPYSETPPPPQSRTPAAPPSSSLPPQSASSNGPSGQPSTVFPALHLIPLNETFVPKQISLSPPGARIKIGRQTNAKTIPNGTNGYFDSKVLSRMHAEVWSENGKVLIKDVKSSNGTFIDGNRLSPEAAESDVFELRTGAIVEFGIDIVSDDSKTIVHHKVAASVYVVMNAEDALISSRAFNGWYRQAGDQPNPRRGARPLQSNGPQQNGLSYDHVFTRVQTELQKARESGVHLGELNSTLNDVHDTLGGGAPPPFPPGGLPLPASARSPNGYSANQQDAHAQSIAALQSQLNETQHSLAGHVGKIRDLEGLLAEHDTIKREVGTLRKQMEDAQRDMDEMLRRGREGKGGAERTTDGRESPVAAMLEAQEAEDELEEEDDDDDARSTTSVDTIVGGAGKANGVKARGIKSNNKKVDTTTTTDHGDLLETSGTPPPSFAEMTAPSEADLARERQLQEQNAKLSARLEALSVELDEATKLGQSLRSQHAEASSTIRALEARVQGLEKAVEGRVKEVEGKVIKEVEERWNGWRETFEESWKKEREGWEVERTKLVEVVREWEEKKKREEEEELAESEESEDEDEASGSASDDDETSQLARSTTSTASSTKSNTNKSSTSSKRTRSSRRRRRHTATLPRVAKLAQSDSPDAVASDSDSTIGESGVTGGVLGAKGLPGGARGWGGTGGNSGSSSTAAGAFGGQTVGGQGGAGPQGLPYAATGAVVIIGVAAAWALSMKLKE